MDHKLSVIMPCYNCVTTLKEAVDSVFTQNFVIPFEIVMVDDGSADGTRQLMEDLAKIHPEIKCFYHEKNQGGGATRNTAVEKTSGDVIFCLDSDDILSPGVLPKMIKYLDKKNCDGVIFEKSKYFLRNPKKVSASAFNIVSNDNVVIDDLFKTNTGILTMVNFLYTKKAFQSVGGYPIHHGFDTQGFGFDFLAKGLKVFICPDTSYFHRQSKSMNSYFQRVYKGGLLSRNSYLIFENAMYLFSPQIRRVIMEFDMFNNTKLNDKNLKAKLDILYSDLKDAFFIDNKERYLTENGSELFFEDHKDSDKPEDIFCLGIYYYKMGNFEKALEFFTKLLKLGVNSKIIYYNILRSSVSISSKQGKGKVEEEAVALVQSLLFKKQKLNYFLFLLAPIYTKIIKIFKKPAGVRKRVVILWHNGGRLANQLWLFISVYAYCLEMGYKLENHCFFEYSRYFRFPVGNRLIDYLFFKSHNFLKTNLPRKLFVNQHNYFFRWYYKVYERLIRWFYKDSVIYAEHDKEAKECYLKPTKDPDDRFDKFEESKKTKIYLHGWLFRNPVGIEKYRNEIVRYFRPVEAITAKVDNFLIGLSEKYETIVGVHIRQGDYQKEFAGGKFYLSNEEVNTVLNQYLKFAKKRSEDVCFVICSDGLVDLNLFSGLNAVKTDFSPVEDLYLLSQTSTIIGSDSTFGVFASYYGNVPLVVMKKDGIDWDYYLDKKKYFENKYSSFYLYER